MELLLNLLWVTIAAAALCKVGLDGRAQRSAAHRSRLMGLLAAGCVLALLFPIVSASDDLHGDQVFAEDAINRVSHCVSPLQQNNDSGNTWLVFSVLSLLSLLLVRLSDWDPSTSAATPTDGYRFVENGRAPPVLG